MASAILTAIRDAAVSGEAKTLTEALEMSKITVLRRALRIATRTGDFEGMSALQKAVKVYGGRISVTVKDDEETFKAHFVLSAGAKSEIVEMAVLSAKKYGGKVAGRSKEEIILKFRDTEKGKTRYVAFSEIMRKAAPTGIALALLDKKVVLPKPKATVPAIKK